METHCFIFPLGVLLCQDGSCGKSRGVDLKKEWLVEVWLLERQVRKHDFDECVQCLSALGRPLKGVVFTCEVSEWFCNGGIVGNEGSLISQHSKDAADLFHFGEFAWPVFEPVGFH